jgi:shikimate kinase
MIPSTQQGAAQVPQGVNQMLEIFKMQYLMKFLDSSGGGSGGSRSSFLTIIVLMAYDHLVRYIPVLIQAATAYFQKKDQPQQQTKLQDLLLPSTTPPPAQKTVKAFIQYERAADGKLSDPRIDAVIHHVCNLPDVRSLRYNGVEMMPNFKDVLMIENDVWFEIIQSQGTISSTGTGAPKHEPILYRLSTYDHDITWLHRFVEQAIEAFEQEKRNKLGNETYYFDQLSASADPFRNPLSKKVCMFTRSKFTSNRSLNNVYLKQIDELKERVEFFIRRRDWYDQKGIPHTLGIVMYGHPGCGKTSTIKAIANETKRHIFNIMLSEIKTKDALKDLFYNDQVNVLGDGKTEVLNIPLRQRIYVIEDIDAMNSIVIKRSAEELEKERQHKLQLEAEIEHLKRAQGETLARNMVKGKEDTEADKLDLATLLNVLDGVRETPGRIIILSTNYPERLDEALLRPGRFDMMLEFEKHSCEVLKQHIEKHYDIELTEEQVARISTPFVDKKWTPAEVGQILFRRVGNPDAAIKDLVEEDPAKLFRFSQMKRQTETTATEEGAGTDLNKLLLESSE